MTTKGSWFRPHNAATYGKNYERVFGETYKLVIPPCNGAWNVRLWEDWDSGGFMAVCSQLPPGEQTAYGQTRDDCLEDMRKLLVEFSDKNRKRLEK